MRRAAQLALPFPSVGSEAIPSGLMAAGDITRDAVLDAIAEYKRLGPAGFRQEHGYGDATAYELVHDGERFPSKGIYGVAYERVHHHPPSNLTGGVSRVVPELKALGFEVQGRETTSERLRAAIEQVLAEYEDARKRQAYGSSAPIWGAFKELANSSGLRGRLLA